MRPLFPCSIYLGAQLGAGLEGAGATYSPATSYYYGTASSGISSVGAVGLSAGVVTYLQTGDFNSSVKAGFFAAVTAGVANKVGHGMGFKDAEWGQKAAMHGLTQGGIGVLRGDKFVHGFVAAYVSDVAGTGMGGQYGDIYSRTIIAAGLSQIAVEAVGGEGNQWALVGALVHLFNAEEHIDRALGRDHYDSQGSLFDGHNPSRTWHVNDANVGHFRNRDKDGFDSYIPLGAVIDIRLVKGKVPGFMINFGSQRAGDGASSVYQGGSIGVFGIAYSAERVGPTINGPFTDFEHSLRFAGFEVYNDNLPTYELGSSFAIGTGYSSSMYIQ